jgi:hypothetical protein
MSYLFIYFLLIHWLADFVCQTDWMARNKSTDLHALFSHILVYTSVIYCGLILVCFKYDISTASFVGFILINSFTHFIIDLVTSRITSTLYKANDIHNFFVVIGFDQFLHIAILFASYTYFIGL